MGWLRTVRMAFLLAGLSLLAGGCFMRLALGGVEVHEFGDAVTRSIAAFSTNATTAVCDAGPTGRSEVTCTYFIASEEGPFAEVTSTAELIDEFGLFGVFIDPLILQVPEGASDFSATFTDAGVTDDLVMTVTDRFLAAPGRDVVAEQGMTFLIVELPDDVASELPEGDPRLVGREFDFEVTFEVPELAPVELKAMLTLAIDHDGVRHYPPMLPCVTDFAEVPSFELPVGFGDLSAQVASAALGVEDLACDGEMYDFTSDDPADPEDPADPVDPDDPDDPGASSVIAIDVLPGSDRNPVTPGRQGVLPVAVLGASVDAGHDHDFDVSTVDIATVRLGPGEAAARHDHHDLADVNGDGVVDLVLHFPVADSGIACGDEAVTLTGYTLGGAPISGTDSITTVPCHGSGRPAPLQR